jgi:hypothetical protein
MTENLYGLNLIVYGHAKQGKSWLADTAPAPRVILDAEAGSRFTPSRKKLWQPVSDPPPVPDGTWDTAIVPVRAFKDVTKCFEWLNSGKHPFRSVIIDSISEVQQRIVDDIAGTNQMRTQDWGTLLRVGSDVIRKFRDLVTNPVKPMDAVVFIAMASQRQDQTWCPYMQGKLSTTLPYYVDVVGYLVNVPQEDGTTVRRMFVGNTPGYETGERVGGRLGTYIDNPNIASMIEMVRGEATEAEEIMV